MSGTHLKKVDSLLKDITQKLLIVNKGRYVHVGPFVVFEDQKHFVLFRDDEVIQDFTSKKAAIAFAVSEYNRTTNLSNQIKRYDDKMKKHKQDIFFFRRTMLLAENKQNEVRQDIMACRLDHAYGELQSTKQLLMIEIKKVKIS